MSAPASATPAPSKVSLILAIVQGALSIVGNSSLPAEVISLGVDLLKNGLSVYQAETGQPLDLSKIPQEAPLP